MASEKQYRILLDCKGKNYIAWKFQQTVLLKKKKIFDVVSGERIVDANTPEEMKKIFTENDLEAQEIIVSAVDEKVLMNLISCASAKDMWNRLQALFAKSDQTSIHALQQQFYAYKYENEGIAYHIAQLENLSYNLKGCGESISDNMLINKILMTLPSDFKHFHSAWDSSSEKTINHLTSRLLAEEERLKLQQLPIDVNTEALLTKRLPWKNKSESNQYRRGQKDKTCNYCKRVGHWKNECWFRNKNQPGCSKYTSKNTRKQPENSHALMLDNDSDDSNCQIEWFLDSGASNHMSSNFTWFLTYEKFTVPKQITIGDGSKIEAIGKGNIPVLVWTKDLGWESANIEDVLYIPKLKYNLFSVSAVVDKGYILRTNKYECSLLKNGRIIISGTRQENLFKLKMKLREEDIATFSKKEDLNTWHEKLAHQNIRQCSKILKNNGINISEEEIKHFQCSACIFGKQHREPFQPSTSKTTKCGELIHMDVCGPMEEDSISGCKYFLLLKDDFSNYRQVYFMKRKNEVIENLKYYIPKFRRETGKKIQTIRSDNGLEVNNSEIRKLLKTFCIRQELTVCYTPEQNGKAEREIRILVEAARTCLHAQNLEKKYWAEAVNYVAYVLNRTSKSAIDEETSFEAYWGKKPSIHYFQIFGSEAYVHIPKEKRQKWDRKSEKGIFVGYGENVKGYRVYFPQEMRLGIYRDIIFKKFDEKPEIRQQSNLIPIVLNNQQSEMNREEIEVRRNSLETISEERRENVDCNQENSIPDDENQTIDIREKRAIHLPKHFEDYQLFMAMNEEIKFDQAVEDTGWREAMNNELDALMKNKTWILVDLPENRKTVKNRWVFTIKSNGLKKARLVAKGYSQNYGEDYTETFSPVAEYRSIRLVLGIAATNNFEILQFDVKTAYLNGLLEEEIYMDQPVGFDDYSGKVCLLKKSLYGLKQSARCWNDKFTSVLKSFDLQALNSDPCIYVRLNEKGDDVLLILIIYVDDGLIMGKHIEELEDLLSKLETNFEIRKMKLENFLGIEIKRTNRGIFICQEKYTKKILQRFGMEHSNAVRTPILKTELNNVDSSVVDVPFREAIGSLMFLATISRPDISYCTNLLSRYMENPRKVHWEGVKRILRYLQGSKSTGLYFASIPEGSEVLEAFTDADFAGDELTRRSTSGYVLTYNRTVIDWFVRKQSVVALSTAEAEYIAAAEGLKSILSILNLVEELMICRRPIKCYVDNKSAIAMMNKDNAMKRTKHIDTKFHFIKEKVNKDVLIEHVPSSDQLADMMTKALGRERLEYLKIKMSIIGGNVEN